MHMLSPVPFREAGAETAVYLTAWRVFLLLDWPWPIEPSLRKDGALSFRGGTHHAHLTVWCRDDAGSWETVVDGQRILQGKFKFVFPEWYGLTQLRRAIEITHYTG